MTQVTLKLSRSINGIREVSQFNRPQDDFEETGFENNQKKLKPIDRTMVDAHTIKALKDRLKIVEKELQRAREESFLAGYEEGKQSVMQEAEKRIEVVRIEMQALEIKYIEAIESIEAPLLRIAKKMAGEIIADELQLRDDHDELLFKRLRRMIYEVIDQNKTIIQVNPEHLKRLDSTRIAEDLNLPQKMEVRVVAGKNLQPVETIVQTEDFFIDGTFAEQLNQMEDQLIQKEKRCTA